MSRRETPVAVWRSFLSTSEDVEPPITLLKTAREDAKAAKEDAASKEEQLQLMTAMLHAAEEELKLRSNQLDITNAMLKATEAELARKEEQLEITTSMLRTAEKEISTGDQERRSLRQELATMRDRLNSATRMAAVVNAPASTAAPDRGSSSSGGGGGGDGARAGGFSASADGGRGGSQQRANGADARAAAVASKLAAELASVGKRAVGSHAAVPADLPVQQAHIHAARVTLEHGDPRTAMRPKAPIRDVRADPLAYIESRSLNPNLPIHHTSMVLPPEAGGPEANEKDHDVERLGVDRNYVPVPVRASLGRRPAPG
jgi:hypothetical protein